MLALTACGNSAQAESASGNDGGTSRNTNIQTETSASLENTEQNVSQADNSTQPEQTERDSELLDVSRQESADNARPEIAGTVDNMDDYDTIFIGYPNWWGDMPMIVYNFLESYDLSGKTIVLFCTHGGRGLSNTESTIADLTDGTMKDGFAISGTTAQNDRDTVRSQVTEWLRKDGFIE